MLKKTHAHKFFFVFIILTGLIFAETKTSLPIMKNTQDIENYFPKTVQDLEKKKQEIIQQFNLDLNKFLALKSDDYEEVAVLYDRMYGKISFAAALMESIVLMHQDQQMRQMAQDAHIEIQKIANSSFYEHPQIYQVFCGIDLTNLTAERKYFFEDTKQSLERMGLGLPLEKRKEAIVIHEDIAKAGAAFSTNIRESRPKLSVKRADLKGMEDAFINSLEKDANGDYVITTDYPVLFPILRNCQVEETRKKLYVAQSQRGYPENIPVLNELKIKRRAYAKVLGFDSYAAYQLSQEMAKTPKTAQSFLNEMATVIQKKQKQEFAVLEKQFAKEFNNQKIEPWNLTYCLNNHLKKNYEIDEEVIKQYFPLENVLRGLIDIFSKFFGIRFEEIKDGFVFDKEARLFSIFKADTNELLGQLFLDFFPRAGKYTHACSSMLIPPVIENGQSVPALQYIICNFPKGGDVPSLLTHSDIVTLFHEFGHAFHGVLGRTDLLLTAGNNTKRDFVELPSQLLENWCWSATVLRALSSHYKTHEKLSDKEIEKIIKAQNVFSGIQYMRQIMLSNYSLNLFAMDNADIKKLWVDLSYKYRPEISFYPNDYFYLSFGHLDEYGACYYGYLWSNVYAKDVFQQIEKEGLSNPVIGKKYVREILGKGGSQDPNILIENFLDRKPSQTAFFQSIGILEEHK